VHCVFQRRVELEVLDRIWAALVEECEELSEVEWEWQIENGSPALLGGGAMWR
jgi:hypothetical protein